MFWVSEAHTHLEWLKLAGGRQRGTIWLGRTRTCDYCTLQKYLLEPHKAAICGGDKKHSSLRGRDGIFLKLFTLIDEQCPVTYGKVSLTAE